MKSRYLLLLLFFIGCSAKVKPTLPEKPEWLSAKPFPSGYYTGIGHSVKELNTNYIQIAKKSAFEDLVSEIKVTVSSTSVLSQLDVNKEFSERYEQVIQTEAADDIEEFELVDAWEDATNYWVYYRLSKERYREIKEEQKRNAVLLASDFYGKANVAYASGERIQAMGYYFQALRSLEKYLGEAIRVTIDNREIVLTNELYAAIQNSLDKIELTVAPSSIEINRRINQQEESVLAKAIYKDIQKPASQMPLRAAFQKGQGIVYPTYKADGLGIAKILLTKIDSRELEQTVGLYVDVETLAGPSSSPIFSFIVQRLQIPEAKILLNVKRPMVFLTADEKSFGYVNHYNQLTNKLKNLLANAGFEFTDSKRAADLWIDVHADTDRGSITGSIYITYVTGIIRVSTVKEGKEIYATTLDRVKGYGLDYDRSCVDGYAKTLEALEKERFAELLNTVLQ